MPYSDYFLTILPLLLSVFLCLTCLIIVCKRKYKLWKTLLICIPITLIIAIINGYIFIKKGSDLFKDWFVVSVFIPEAILVGFISKRKGKSIICALLNSFLVFYMMFLLESALSRFINNVFWLIIIVYFVSFPLIIVFEKKVYNKLHDIVEKSLPNFLYLLSLYAIGLIFEIWLYNSLVSMTDKTTLKVDIFGVAILSVYIISILGFTLFLKEFKKKSDEVNELKIVEQQVNLITHQYAIKSEKENELRIYRHDMKHLLNVLSSLILKSKRKEALKLIKEYNEKIDSTIIKKYCNDVFINSVIEYYDHLCKENNIKFIINMNNFEDALKIPPQEIAILLANCLDNAINASLKINENRMINLTFLNNNGRLALMIKNNFDGNIIFDKNNKPTNYEKDHGLGSKSIDKIAKKYGLIVDYLIKNHSFIIKILFKN